MGLHKWIIKYEEWIIQYDNIPSILSLMEFRILLTAPTAIEIFLWVIMVCSLSFRSSSNVTPRNLNLEVLWKGKPLIEISGLKK